MRRVAKLATFIFIIVPSIASAALMGGYVLGILIAAFFIGMEKLFK